MRLLYLTEETISFSKAMVRGGAIHVQNVVEGLRDRGHDVTLIDWNADPERGFQCSITPRTRFVADPLQATLRAIRRGRQACPDAVISKTRKTYLPGLAAARWLGVPHVVHVGSSLNPPTESWLARADLASFRARLRAPHNGYLVVCKHIGQQLADFGVDADRVYNVLNAVDTDRFHPKRIPTPLDDRFTTAIDAAAEGVSVGFVGGLQPAKGLGDLAAAVKSASVDASVLIAGDGPARAQLERTFGDRATFLGSVPYAQVPALYHAFDLLVLPSHTEGLPRVVLEAQATGTPVIATRVGGIPEIIIDGETGLLCPPRRPPDLAAALDRLGSDASERARLGQNGRRAVEQGFSWPDLYDRYERALTRVID
jgi:glycosyltransferase involved in cell wall biosynthesis